MLLFQSFYSRIANLFLCFTKNLRNKERYTIVFLCFFLISAYFVFYFIKATYSFLYEDLTRNHLIGCVLLFIATVSCVRREARTVEWNKVLFCLMTICGLSMLVISVIHPVGSGYRAFSLMLLLGYPFIYYVLNNNGSYSGLFTCVSAAFSLAGILYFLYCIYLAFQGSFNSTGGRVYANMYNANLISMTGMSMCISAAYLLFEKKTRKKWNCFSIVSLGIGNSLVLLGGSRLSILVNIGIVFCAAVFIVKRKGERNENSLKKMLIKAGIVLISCGLFVLFGATLVDINTRAAQPEEPVVISTQNTGEAVSEVKDTNLERFSSQGKDINSFTSGRVVIWRGYSSKLNLIGNDFSKSNWTELTNNTVNHAHNNFLEFGYRFGIPVALIHLLLELYAGIYALKLLFSKKYTEPMHFYIVICVMTFAIESMFDIATLPFERHAPFFFYIAIAPLFTEPYLIRPLNNRKGTIGESSDEKRLSV